MKRIALLVFLALWITGSKLSAQDMALKTNLLYDATTTLNLGYEVALNHRTTLDIGINYNPWTLGHKWVGLMDKQQPVTGSASERESRLKHFMIQPEVRWWLCEKFNGHFFGVHLHGGVFDVGAMKMPFGWGRYKDASGNYLGSYPKPMSPVEYPVIDAQNPINGIGYEISDKPYPGLGSVSGTELEPNDVYWGNADRDGIYTNNFEGWFVGVGVSYGYHWILSRRLSMEFSLGLGYAYLDYDKSRCTDCKKKIGEESAHYFGPTRVGISLVYMIK
ncbi:MAG: DUF3575 domain-containing protein [Tannerella sp.]|jgi:hypothetical protein|nr:DUF3575 domain-containing protein [Tannerella sp.]